VRRRPAHIRDLLEKNPAGSACLAPQDATVAFGAKVLALLPEPLRGHCAPGPVRDGTLTLILDSPAWATRARYQAADLVAELKPMRIDAIRVLVRPPKPAVPDEHQRKVPRLSPKVARLLSEAAEATDDPYLARALRNLARRAVEEPPLERKD
jgi:hypothetical protein